MGSTFNVCFLTNNHIAPFVGGVNEAIQKLQAIQPQT